jgi:hypothetical protein
MPIAHAPAHVHARLSARARAREHEHDRVSARATEADAPAPGVPAPRPGARSFVPTAPSGRPGNRRGAWRSPRPRAHEPLRRDLLPPVLLPRRARRHARRHPRRRGARRERDDARRSAGIGGAGACWSRRCADVAPAGAADTAARAGRERRGANPASLACSCIAEPKVSARPAPSAAPMPCLCLLQIWPPKLTRVCQGWAC